MSRYAAAIISILFVLLVVGITFYLMNYGNLPGTEEASSSKGEQQMANESWRDKLTPMQYYVTREHGTERAFTGEYWDHKEDGIYKCVCCGQPLFDSKTKFDSGTGWPSFFDLIASDRIQQESDDSLIWERRTEVICSGCDAHLGHVFPDGPAPTGLRYCVNSAALDFDSRSEAEDNQAK